MLALPVVHKPVADEAGLTVQLVPRIQEVVEALATVLEALKTKMKKKRTSLQVVEANQYTRSRI